MMRKYIALLAVICAVTTLGACSKFNVNKSEGGAKTYTPAPGDGITISKCEMTVEITPYERPLAINLADGKYLLNVALTVCVNKKTKPEIISNAKPQIQLIATNTLSKFKKSDLSNGADTLEFVRDTLKKEISKEFDFVLDVYPYDFVIEDNNPENNPKPVEKPQK